MYSVLHWSSVPTPQGAAVLVRTQRAKHCSSEEGGRARWRGRGTERNQPGVDEQEILMTLAWRQGGGWSGDACDGECDESWKGLSGGSCGPWSGGVSVTLLWFCSRGEAWTHLEESLWLNALLIVTLVQWQWIRKWLNNKWPLQYPGHANISLTRRGETVWVNVNVNVTQKKHICNTPYLLLLAPTRKKSPKSFLGLHVKLYTSAVVIQKLLEHIIEPHTVKSHTHHPAAMIIQRELFKKNTFKKTFIWPLISADQLWEKSPALQGWAVKLFDFQPL